MNIRCPQCQAVFRVDPDKVPQSGVKARCARCSGVFALSRSGLVEPARAEAPAGSNLAPAAAHAAEPAAVPGPAAAAAPASPSALAQPPAVPLPARDATDVARPARPVFGKQDPHTRANRIARALVSDIVAYHRERRDRTLAAGTLKLEFREEIRKSWEEYVEQVGLDLARGTPYFRDALNAILANGNPVF